MIWFWLRYPRASFRLLHCKIFGHKWHVMGRDNDMRLYVEGCDRCGTARLTSWESWK